MLEVIIPEMELFDEKTETFIKIKETKLQLEHSLISLKKWESKWHIPFLGKSNDLTTEQLSDYIHCICLLYKSQRTREKGETRMPSSA